MSKPADYVVTLRAVRDPVAPARDPAIRLRLALKRFLRLYGLRAVKVTTAPLPETAGVA